MKADIKMPKFKVFNPMGIQVAVCDDPVNAAVLVAFWGEGSIIRSDLTKNKTLWHEGKEEIPASESYDNVTQLVYERLKSHLMMAYNQD